MYLSTFVIVRYFSGQDIQPKRDLSRFVRWPKYIRLQRQKAVLMRRLKVPPTINQFTQGVDRQLGECCVIGRLRRILPIFICFRLTDFPTSWKVPTRVQEGQGQPIESSCRGTCKGQGRCSNQETTSRQVSKWLKLSTPVVACWWLQYLLSDMVSDDKLQPPSYVWAQQQKKYFHFWFLYFYHLYE